jgi:hypothetical protein
VGTDVERLAEVDSHDLDTALHAAPDVLHGWALPGRRPQQAEASTHCRSHEGAPAPNLRFHHLDFSCNCSVEFALDPFAGRVLHQLPQERFPFPSPS